MSRSAPTRDQPTQAFEGRRFQHNWTRPVFLPVPFSFLGYRNLRFDPITGNLETESREIQTSTGTFMGQDPTRFKAGDLANANLYAYVGGNPLNLTDPTGHFSYGELMVAMTTLARLTVGTGFFASGVYNLALSTIDLVNAHEAAQRGTYNGEMATIGYTVMAIVHAYTGISNIQLGLSILGGVPGGIIPPGMAPALEKIVVSCGGSAALIGEQVLELGPTIAGIIVNAAGAALATNALFQSSYGQGGGGSGGQSFRQRVEEAIVEKLQIEKDPVAESWAIKKLRGPTAMSDNKDSRLGPNQQRWYASMENEYSGERKVFSVNYDPDTGEFGIIKPSSDQEW